MICQKHDFAFTAYDLFPRRPPPVQSKWSWKRSGLS